MISYTLKCDEGHRFDSWFQSAQAYDKLKAAGMVACASCGSTKIEKAMMAPTVRPARSAAQGPAHGADQGTGPNTSQNSGQNSGQTSAQPSKANQAQTPAHTPPAAPSLTAPSDAREAAIAELRKQVEANSDYVGMNFAAEARAIHDGSAPERPIYGEAKPEEARELIEEGVPVAPLPFRPTRKSN